jgi:hypothetical protein
MGLLYLYYKVMSALLYRPEKKSPVLTEIWVNPITRLDALSLSEMEPKIPGLPACSPVMTLITLTRPYRSFMGFEPQFHHTTNMK